MPACLGSRAIAVEKEHCSCAKTIVGRCSETTVSWGLRFEKRVQSATNWS